MLFFSSCHSTSVTEFFKATDVELLSGFVEDMSVDEVEVTCSPMDDVCVGAMDVTVANFTQEGTGKMVQGFRVSLSKGCGRMSTLRAINSPWGTYDDKRHCWVGKQDVERASNLVSGSIMEVLGLDER